MTSAVLKKKDELQESSPIGREKSICASGFGRLGFALIMSNYHAILAQVS